MSPQHRKVKCLLVAWRRCTRPVLGGTVCPQYVLAAQYNVTAVLCDEQCTEREEPGRGGTSVGGAFYLLFSANSEFWSECGFDQDVSRHTLSRDYLSSNPIKLMSHFLHPLLRYLRIFWMVAKQR